MSLVVDEAIVSANVQLLNILAFSFTLVLLINASVSWLRAWSLMGLNATVSAQASENILAHLTNLPVPFFEARHLGDVLSRLGSQKTILNALTEDFIEAMLDGLMVIVTLIVMMLISPPLTFLSLLATILYGLIRRLSYGPIRQAEMEGIVWSAKTETHLLETLRGIRSVKLHNAQSLRRIQWANLNVEAINRGLAVDKISLNIETINQLVIGITSILIVWLGAKSILADQMTVGVLLAFVAYSGMFLSRVSKLLNAWIQFKMLSLHAERLADIALSPAEPVDHSINKSQTLSPAPLSIELKNVSYRYGVQDPYVLKNISLSINKGDWVAITGPSGSGKSTLLKILSGLIVPTKGQVLVNGEPLMQFGLTKYRDSTGVVLQEDHLFSGSISENIAFFSEQQDEAKVKLCSKLASIYTDIMDLPMRFSSSVGDMGTVLSGGQKQRVLLARALYKRPGLLLLDEATSHLDINNESKINESLNKLPITRIVIAHRLETIQAANRKIELIDGQVDKLV